MADEENDFPWRTLKTVFKCAVGAAVGITAVIVGPSLLGFRSGGVEKESWAARHQSEMGDVPPDSTFSKLQRIGAKGASTETLVTAGAIGAIGTAVATRFLGR